MEKSAAGNNAKYIYISWINMGIEIEVGIGKCILYFLYFRIWINEYVRTYVGR